MRVLSLFDGISCGRVALERANIKVDCYDAYEIDDNAIKVSKDNYPDIVHKGDVFDATYTEGNYDLLIGGSPCLTGDSLVTTKLGLQELKDIEVGSKVLGHDKEYHKVIGIFDNGVKDVFRLYSPFFDKLIATGNHKFYVRKKTKYETFDREGNKYYKRCFETPIWKDVQSIIEEPSFEYNYYLGCAINQKKTLPKWNGITVNVNQYGCTKKICNLNMSDVNLWYLVGRWLGDGWFRSRKGAYRQTYTGITICCAFEELTDLLNNIPKYFNYTVVKDKTVYKVQFSNTELAMFLSQFGEHANGKYLPGFVFDMPKKYLKSLLKGYLDSDGCITQDDIYATTVSKKLAYGIAYCVMKVYNRPACVNYLKPRKKPQYIDGRLIHQSEQYLVQFKRKDSQAISFYEDGYVWCPLKKIEKINKQRVFDIEVEGSHSFIANNCIVHNCTYWSISGAGQGIREVTAEGLGWELFSQYVRALREVKPKWFLYENNASMADEIRECITYELGIEPIMIDSADFSAQHRKRLYWTNIPLMPYTPSDILFSDIMEQDVERVKRDFTKYADTIKVSKDGLIVSWDTSGKGYYSQANRARKPNQKWNTVPASKGGNDKNNIWIEDTVAWCCTAHELERLQTLPDDYTKILPSTNNRMRVIGNGWTVDVIVHLLSGLPKERVNNG